MTAPEPITLVALGDTHCGSRSAICVPDMQLCGGGSFRYSAAQRGLYDAYTGLTKDWLKPDILLVNGDAIEGQARKESGVPCWSTDLIDQIECAKQLFEMFHAKKIYLTEGTGYHVDAAGKSLEHVLGEKLNAVKIGTGRNIAGEQLFLRINNFTFHAAHHIGVSTGWYLTTPMAKELIFALLNESDIHKVDIVLRSHVHSFVGVEFHRQRGYVLPCWQLKTRYMFRKTALGMMPSIGAIRFRIYPDEIRMDKRFFKVVEAKPKLFRYEETDKE